MHHPVISFAASLCLLTTIATAGPWYLFVEGGTTRFSHHLTTLTDSGFGPDQTVTSRDNNAGSLSAGLGWEWSQSVAVEVSHFESRETVEAWRLTAPPPGAELPETVKLAQLRRGASGCHAGIVISTAPWRQFTAGVSLGAGRFRVVEEPRFIGFLLNPIPPRNDQWTFCPAVGARVGYTLSDHLGLRLKYERLLPDDLETWSPDLELGIFSLGATWRF